ncbi:hypothetical protein AMTRI_Chr08g165180 [Amborella trichopoda]|uniref:Pentacotripeptide-repeat region of PRORP domain-containing protein n=1 Tax=Amborella trichopoda TaxID=13333 RepID=W1NJQ5_AMBTC|nr:pentatricopeptide repeat-containing protein At1g55630 isoform X1 [Amborella trichopoda]XP_020530115.1 pentatricopeptide repeat-containing protein At1g55630 isoform X1 [Amborella trichopoda]XP_020530120.1 pentatricopeptide repeat-containing protein At1g55630 isoform X1 [Amborella trichopoda]ERM95733.1 hypothetical protein AMTR_s00023p00240990 [Amborella trichopoda]|eukprot:XP_020530107.1 pentatricopeptide repeat-containing protein At1g55630 isoform X1 [Amborella trichopoda]
MFSFVCNGGRFIRNCPKISRSIFGGIIRNSEELGGKEPSEQNVENHSSNRMFIDSDVAEKSSQKPELEQDVGESLVLNELLSCGTDAHEDDPSASFTYGDNPPENFTQNCNRSPLGHLFYDSIVMEANKIFEVLRKDGPGFDLRCELDAMEPIITNRIVREVLLKIKRGITDDNRERSAKLGYKFFVWLGQQKDYRHTSNTYNLMLEIFSDTGEFKPMWRLVDEMIRNGIPATARTFNILICTCGDVGLARRVVERFLKTKAFNYRPFKHSYNAILHSLLGSNLYKLIEWVYNQMLRDGHSPDTLSYNILIFAKYKMGELHKLHRFLVEMSESGFAPDFHTYNIMLNVLGRGNKPAAASKLLNYMDEVGCHPRVIHFTALIDGFSRAGKLEECLYYFEEMLSRGCMPDVVCYTVMITGFIAWGELDRAQEFFHDMINNGNLPNVFTYNSMIRGFCMAGKFEDACYMLKDMESRGCNPNFQVYSTLVENLRSAGKVSLANEIISQMVEKGRYIQLISKFRRYRRL